jgi:nicotinate dehydrogenase subunit B
VKSLSDGRALAVLNALRPAWQSRRPGGHGVGAGIAYQQYGRGNAHVASYVDVSVDTGTGAIRVERVIVAHDCGLIRQP